MNPTTNVTTTNTGATTSVMGTNVPQTFTFDQINGTAALNTPVAPAPTNLLAGLGQTTQNDANQTNQQQTQEQNTYVDLLTSLGSQTADTQALQDQQGVTTMQKDLLGLQNIARQQQAQYNAGIVQAEAARNTRQETNVVQQNLTRQHGIDALLTNSLIAAKQGDITFANSLVDRAIAAKYEPIKAKLEAQKFILDQVNGKAAENRKIALDVKMKEIEKQESRDKTLQEMIIDANAQGAPTQVLNAAQDLITRGATPAQVASALGQYSGAAAKAELLREQIKTEQTQRAKLNQDIAKTRAEMKSGGSNVPTIKSINGVDMQWDGSKWIPAVVSATAMSPELVNKSLDQLSFLKTTATEAKALSNAAGPSLIRKVAGDTFVGDTGFRRLENKANTLKVNVLSLMTDPTIKKFFGPQMSNADVKLMTGAGTTLDAEANSPQDIKNEIVRLEDLFSRMEKAVKSGSTEYQYFQSVIPAIDKSSSGQTTASDYANTFK